MKKTGKKRKAVGSIVGEEKKGKKEVASKVGKGIGEKSGDCIYKQWQQTVAN